MVYNDFESPVGNQITAGTYTISPLGRITITGAVPQPLNLSLNFQFYLDGNGNAIELGVDGNEVSEGPSFLPGPQQHVQRHLRHSSAGRPGYSGQPGSLGFRRSYDRYPWQYQRIH